MENGDNAALVAAIVAVIGIVARQVLEMIAKEIPDDATGWPGVWRKVFKTLAMYRKNKETGE